MRNLLAHVTYHDKKRFAEKLKQVWLPPDLESAKQDMAGFIEEYEPRFPSDIECLVDGLEDSLQCYRFPVFGVRKIISTNTLERLNKEIRRKTKVVGIFPSRESYIRWVATYLGEYTEDWITTKNNFTRTNILEMETDFKERKQRLAA
jgi:putative transposase